MSPIISEIRLLDAHTLEVDGEHYPCRIGPGGIAQRDEKREGDMKTPSGSFALRGCYYRPDRISPPPTTPLPLIALVPDDGWCDDAAHPLYNQPVKLPFAGRHEKLWRDDHVYDLVIPLGYNDGIDAVVIPGAGSAIFLHLMRDDAVGTEGCIAVAREMLLAWLPRLSAQTKLIVSG